MAKNDKKECVSVNGDGASVNPMNGLTNDLNEKMKSEALELKEKANKFFKEANYSEAVNLYTECIKLDGTNAIFYCNRSLANLRLELNGAALADAADALKLQPGLIKALYRRASANVAIGRLGAAMNDLETVLGKLPNNPEVKKKLRLLKEMAFLRSIRNPNAEKETYSNDYYKSININENYEGPRIQDDGEITEHFMSNLLNWFEQGKNLHLRYAFQMLLKFREFMKKLPSLIDITFPEEKHFTVCGDIHGQFYDLLNIFKINGKPSTDNPYLFNGDFVDRGSFSVECIFTLIGYKLLYPNHFYMSRGNHESIHMNQMYGFEGEVTEKLNSACASLFHDVFNTLPLCHVINKKVFVTHGGIGKEETFNLEEIRKVNRFRQPPDSGIMCDLLWSDPFDGVGTFASKRGVGIQFGSDITEKFCERNNLLYVIRSHEVKMEGYVVQHHGKLITDQNSLQISLLSKQRNIHKYEP
ncbi:hypothetical protein SNEBB_010435 [Seison nebaliae]|nr:hypothetical protein SNEBB_010435 [Seison nebaliae]